MSVYVYMQTYNACLFSLTHTNTPTHPEPIGTYVDIKVHAHPLHVITDK